MTPEKLILNMAESAEEVFPRLRNFVNLGSGKAKSLEISEQMLRIVLKAIDDGEVAEAGSKSNDKNGYPTLCVVLKPEYQKFLKGE